MRYAVIAISCIVMLAFATESSADFVHNVWEKTYDGGNGDDYVFDVAFDSQGNVISAGRITAGALEATSAYAIKYSPDGTALWNIEVEQGPAPGPSGSVKADSNDSFRAVAVDSNDDILLTGSISGTWLGYSMGSYHQALLLQKYEPDGGERLGGPVWQQIWQDGSGSAWQGGFGVVTDVNDNIYTASIAFHAWDDVTEGEWATLKFDPDGNITLGPLYYNNFDQHFLQDRPYDVAVDSDGNIIVVGISAVSGVEGGIVNNVDWHVRKYDPAGSLIWQDTFAGSMNLYDYAYAVATDDNGDVYVAGFTNTGTDNTSNVDYDWRVIKYAADGIGGAGDRIWSHTYESAPGRSETCNSIVVENDGNVLVGGHERDSSNVIHWRLERLDSETGALLDEHVGNAAADQSLYSISLHGDLIALGGYSKPPCLFGDVNCDGSVNAVDVQLVINKALNLEVNADCDLNGDASVNAVDVQLVINAVLGFVESRSDNNMFTKLVTLSP